MSANSPSRLLLVVGLFVVGFAGVATAAEEEAPRGVYRGTWTVAKFDVSPPLRDITPLPIPPDDLIGRLIPDPDSGIEGEFGPQDDDPIVQSEAGTRAIPAPIVSFDGQPNLFGGAPPDPVGDVGPNHYVAMSNLHFQIFDKTGTSLYGPAANNTLWSGFGGACQNNNDGDPIVLHDQLADRWILTQFTASGSPYYNCVAVSTTADPTGTYYRYAFTTGSNFPDYPKYGVWPDGLYISTREFSGSFVGVGAYAIDRAQLVAGNPSPTVISFLLTPGAVGAYNVGDGLLPSDLDGSTLPAPGTPNFYVGSMDNGAQYSAPQDALTLWKFTADFTTPANSTMILTDTIPIASYDTVFPCSPGSRDCIPQPGTSNEIDILSYRQRPMHRLAYRNFGTHESLVTNQSVEAVTNMAGMRWWEIRDPNGSPTIYQEGTYAPGATDGIHRWMGSIAMDMAGNMALGYSASDSSSTFPSVWYTGREATDPLGTMPQGEGSIVDGTGSQTGFDRWGDYSSMNVDPVDDCTFWYVNEYVPTTSSSGWRLRIGAFKFTECGTPDFNLDTAPASQSTCTGSDAQYTVTVGSIVGFSDPVTMSASGNPGSASYSPNPVIPPGSTTLTISGAAVGNYTFDVVGTSTTGAKNDPVDLVVWAAVPPTAILTSPADGAPNQPLRPTFQWNGSDADSYTIEIATDIAFSTIVYSDTVTGTSTTPDSDLSSSSEFFWRVRASNGCGPAQYSSVFSFFTEPLPGDCGVGTTAQDEFFDDFEAGALGWTHLGTGDTWGLSTARSYSAANSFHGVGSATFSDQRLRSPSAVLPADGNPLTLQFWNWQQMEERSTGGCWDGGLVEISTDGGGTWAHLPDAVMLTDPYDGPVSSLGNLDGWCDDLSASSTVWRRAIVDIDAYAGQTVRFRFRLGTDSGTGREGWYIDDVKVQSCPENVCAPPSGLTNNRAIDSGGCADNGVLVSWYLNPTDWGDQGTGTRSYDLLRDGTPIATGLGYGTTSFTDTTGVNGTVYTYSVRYNNGCGLTTSTAGEAAANNVTVPVPASLAVADIQPCGQTGLQISWDASPGASGYDLRVDGATVISDVTSPYVYDPGSTATHDYEVRAKDASCGPSTWSAPVAGTDGAPPEDIVFCDGVETGDTSGWDFSTP